MNAISPTSNTIHFHVLAACNDAATGWRARLRERNADIRVSFGPARFGRTEFLVKQSPAILELRQDPNLALAHSLAAPTQAQCELLAALSEAGLVRLS